MVVPLIPWLIIFVVVFFVLTILRKRRTDDLLDGRTFKVHVGDSGISWADALTRTEYQWLAFHGFDETANLFVLYLTNPKRARMIHYHLIPKRAFPDAAKLGEFRALLESSMQRQESRFPVIAPKAVLPVDSEIK